MPRYTLTISPDYVKDWGVNDAIRELLQNAIDQESLDKDNAKSIDYDDNSLIIANRNSVLEKSTLLLGGGTKDGSSTIGQFGEGYKVALLVLLREGYTIQIRNYKAGELWVPKIVNSRVYNSQVLAIDTMEYQFETIPTNSLEIIINGIDNAEEILQDIWLDFNPPSEVIRSGKAYIILDLQEKGNIYIKGLKVTHNPSLSYGYNFDVNVLKIGRDRNIVSGYDLQSELGYIWGKIPVEYSKLALDLIECKAYDTEYCYGWKLEKPIKDAILEVYADKKVITDESDKIKIEHTYGNLDEVVIVPEAIRDVVYSNFKATTGTYVQKKTSKQLLVEFKERWDNIMEAEMLEDLDNLIEVM